MRIPYKRTAVAASAASQLGSRFPVHVHNATTSSQILTSAPGFINLYTFDGSSFTTTLNASVPGNPSWIEYVAPNKVYAVDEAGTDMRLFHLSHVGGGVAKLSDPVAVGTGSPGAVHLEFNPDKTRMVSAAYGAGTVDIWDIEDEKELRLIKTIVSTGELGPFKPNQDQAHPHQTVLDPTGRYFVVNDLGTDELLLIDSAGDSWDHRVAASTPPGCGPRHGAFYDYHPGRSANYVVNCELSNDVLVYSVSYGADADVTFTEVQSTKSFVDAVPDGAASAEVVLSADQKTVYVSNRLTGAAADNIARFSIHRNDSISIQDQTPIGGIQPRMFSLAAKGNFLFVANQNGANAITAFSVKKDGSLSDEPVATIPMPVYGGPDAGPTWLKEI
ncbi:Pfam:Muc lac enz [Geosmithia morbida]|uniref:Pfam:Muc lac enz n=1 Tax=Geosmithia morbida TaxID=1094350 RepID=A0A9P4YNQ1_9HYPO|nr:Pfam:Muc lac enz [Geosmithia morbida]KAF4119802.1 Pfam:Muc lac enz [Geosmithia morbida]